MSVAMVKLLVKHLRILEIRDIWLHSLASGFIAEILASGTGVGQSTTFTCGLMHDVERLALCVMKLEEYTHLRDTHKGFRSVTALLMAEVFRWRLHSVVRALHFQCPVVG
jgi:HD-like signal output (HDOD) protein